MTGLLLRALLIGLLSLQTVALRAAPMTPPAAAGAWAVPLCGGGFGLVADGTRAPARSHPDCLDCCLAALDRAPDPARTAPRLRAAARLRRRLAPGRPPVGRPTPRPRSRAPPRPA